MNEERSKARRIALQGLYQLDVQGESYLVDGLQAFVSEETDEPQIREIAYFMAKGTWAYRSTADAWLSKIAAKWPVHRMATVDRNVLRLAIWELVHFHSTPPKVVLDEAITIAKEYSTADSGTFINGVMDAVLREHLAQTGRKID